MATLTLSTNGAHRGQPVHDVEKAELHRFFGDVTADIAIVTLSTEQALAVAYDLLYQAVDAGVLTGWNVQFPESDQYPDQPTSSS
jgi:hypothetical protein